MYLFACRRDGELRHVRREYNLDCLIVHMSDMRVDLVKTSLGMYQVHVDHCKRLDKKEQRLLSAGIRDKAGIRDHRLEHIAMSRHHFPQVSYQNVRIVQSRKMASFVMHSPEDQFRVEL